MPDSKMPTFIGQYKIVEEISNTENSIIYHGRIEEISRDVAIKVINASKYLYEDPLMRIRYEAKSVNLVGHPGIVQIYEVGSINPENYYIVMEYVKGENLAKRLAQHGIPPIRSVIELTSEISAILSYVHERGVVHRDIKPSNIMFTQDLSDSSQLKVKIVDFGLAKIPHTAQTDGKTATGLIMGTMRYASPEQRDDASKVDGKADVYSLGAVVYELLTNVCPKPDFTFCRSPQSPSEINQDILPEFDKLLVQMLSFQVSKRPSMRSVYDSCQSILSPSSKPDGVIPTTRIVQPEQYDSLRARLEAVPMDELKQIWLIGMNGSSPNLRRGHCTIDLEHDVVVFLENSTKSTIYIPISAIVGFYRMAGTWMINYKGFIYGDQHHIGSGMQIVIIP